ncbi:B12-binding domain-containing protein [Paenibacillus athensensis]|uniref:B12-binding N-terminal domain-containing protein n=1 Tax=Paenibacillus athensensis TaxID=1967502 RepID=A0A4Y8PQC6_9BACL|nr:B12-binding domain-containing protein [Paenibacillus athensensis]MCD1260521.1 B12-binding domain-containing protein [Paenibacillus athensensis]
MYSTAEQLSGLLLAGNARNIWDFVQEHIDAGKNSLYIFDKLFSDAMRHIGYLWEQNWITVADEHLASALCDMMIARYNALIEPDSYAPDAGRRFFFA